MNDARQVYSLVRDCGNCALPVTRARCPEVETPGAVRCRWRPQLPVAETLAKATDIFGTKDEAERWMSRPAMGLDGQRPIDLLQTVQGTELVNDFLVRLEYGVYT